MSARQATLCCSGFIFLTFIFVKVLSENVEENVFAFSNNGDCSSIKQAFNGIEMAVSFFKQPPLLSIQKNVDGNFTYEGIAAELINIMSHYFNMTIKYIPVDPSEIDKYGMEIALFRQLEKNEVDFAPYWFQPNADLNDHIDLDLFVWSSQIVLLQRWPAEETRLKAPIRPFSPTVWVCFMGTTMSFLAFLAIYDAILRRITAFREESQRIRSDGTHRDENDNFQNSLSISLLIFYYFKQFSFVVLQGSGSIPYVKRSAIRIAMAVWLLSLVVLQNGYNGVLTSFMTVPKLEPVFNTLEEVLADGRYRITDQKHSVMTNQFLKATNGTYKKIGDSFRNDKTRKLVFGNILQGIENVLHNDCVYPEGDILANYFIREDARINGKCRLTASLKNPLPLIVHVFSGIKKGYPHSKLLNKCYAGRLWSNGIISHLRNKYFPTTDQCRVDADPNSKFRPLTLLDLSPAFFVLCIGILLSILAFLIEGIYHYYLLIRK